MLCLNKFLINNIPCLRLLHTSIPALSLNEFFDVKENYGRTKVRSGRPWTVDDLRLKSNSDLHKLWYVLYKERNMLYTMQFDANQESEQFPSPERIDKVEEGMANIENVVRERNKAYWELEVSPSATGERPYVFRRDVFGRPRWMSCSQHLIPYHRNHTFRLYNSPKSPSENEWFYNKYREMKRTAYNRHRSTKARHIRGLIRRFPNLDIDYIAEQSPEFPPGYIQHLKENIELYKDRPPRYFQYNTVLKNSLIELNENKN